uniref:Proteasomal ATPase-associated factor 1 n=1 Tax=Xenopus tropicalis TaxID=8364 RepID=A0A6I8QGV9_XENTR
MHPSSAKQTGGFEPFPYRLKKAEGEAWISCKVAGKPSIYGNLKCQGISADGNPELTSSDEFVVHEITKKSITVSCPGQNISGKFLSPYTSFSRVHSKNVTCLDISCGGALGVSTSTDQSMKIWQTNNGEIRRILEGHVHDVYCCMFFPSGKVVLSGGMDAQVKIWSVDDGSCPVTLRGHKGGILDLAIVDRGRNVVTCSRDGTARLWDCGQAACISVVNNSSVPINAIALGAVDNAVNLGSPKEAPSDREIGTEGKLLILAREDKMLEGVSLQSRDSVFIFEGSDVFNCCTFISSVGLLAGGQDGNIFHLDVRNPKTPVETICRTGSPVLSLVPFRDGYIASHGDGSCFIAQDFDQVLQLTGPDCEPVYRVAAWEKFVYTCCRDGIIRKYQLSDL